MASTVQAIAFPIADMEQLKVVLASWYTFLGEESESINKEELAEYLKTPVMYNMSEDKLEVLFCGSQELLERFKVRFSNVEKEND